MRNKWVGLLTTFVVFWTISSRANEADQATQLFSYFQATCPTQGEWTKAALGQTQSLIAVLKTVQNDPDCRTLSGAISQLDFLSLRLQDLQANDDQRQVISLKRQQQVLLLQLSSHPDATMLPIIEQSLQANQVALSQYLGYQDADKSVQQVNEGQTLRNLVLSSNILLTQAVAHQSCLLKNPSILTGITSVAGAVAAGAVSSGASVALSAGVNLLGSVMEYIRQAKIGKKIDLFAQNLSSHAYECVLESLTNQWCTAQDAINVIGIKAAAVMGTTPKDQIWSGAKILDRDIPIVLSWLSAVEAGVDPTNQGEGGRQNKVLVRRQMVQSARPLGLGVLSEKIILFNQATSDQQKWVVERSAINDLLNSVGIASGNVAIINNGGGSAPITSPLIDVVTADYAPYFLLGLPFDKAPRTNGPNSPITSITSFDPFTQWPTGVPPFKPDLIAMKDLFLSWLKTAQDAVTNEFTTVLQPDPLRVVSDASTLIRKRGPVKSLSRMVDFLKAQISLGTGANDKIYLDTVTRLNNILTEIQNVIAPQGTPVSTCDQRPLSGDANVDAAKALACIYQHARLEYGTVFIQGRLERSIRIKLNDLLISGQITNPEIAAKLLASEDILKDIQAYSGTTNLAEISRDVEKSQEVTDKNLQEFVNLFGKNITRVLQEKMRLQKSLGGAGMSYYRSRAEICLMLAASPTWPKDVPKEYCLNVQMPAFFSGGPTSVKLTPDQLSKPLNERSCYYRDYWRQSQIYQDFQTEKNDTATFLKTKILKGEGFQKKGILQLVTDNK